MTETSTAAARHDIRPARRLAPPFIGGWMEVQDPRPTFDCRYELDTSAGRVAMVAEAQASGHIPAVREGDCWAGWKRGLRAARRAEVRVRFEGHHELEVQNPDLADAQAYALTALIPATDEEPTTAAALLGTAEELALTAPASGDYELWVLLYVFGRYNQLIGGFQSESTVTFSSVEAGFLLDPEQPVGPVAEEDLPDALERSLSDLRSRAGS